MWKIGRTHIAEIKAISFHNPKNLDIRWPPTSLSSPYKWVSWFRSKGYFSSLGNPTQTNVNCTQTLNMWQPLQSVVLFAHLSAAWYSFSTKSKYRFTRSAVTTVCGLASIEKFNSAGTTGHFSCLKQLKIYEVYPCSAFFATKPYIDINEARHLQKICTFLK